MVAAPNERLRQTYVRPGVVYSHFKGAFDFPHPLTPLPANRGPTQRYSGVGPPKKELRLIHHTQLATVTGGERKTEQRRASTGDHTQASGGPPATIGHLAVAFASCWPQSQQPTGQPKAVIKQPLRHIGRSFVRSARVDSRCFFSRLQRVLLDANIEQ